MLADPRWPRYLAEVAACLDVGISFQAQVLGALALLGIVYRSHLVAQCQCAQIWYRCRQLGMHVSSLQVVMAPVAISGTAISPAVAARSVETAEYMGCWT